MKLIDLRGKRVGEYTILEYVGNKQWRCRCSCGAERIIQGYRLRSKEVTSCGHLGKLDNLEGKKFGSLMVIKYITHGKYTCKCDCGKYTEVTGSNLRNGSTTSCGCKRESIYTREYITNAINLYGGENGEGLFIDELADKIGISYTYMNLLINEYDFRDLFSFGGFSSLPEKEIHEIVSQTIGKLVGEEKRGSLGVIKLHSRNILKSKRELDIYIPSLKIAIEFNGTYWHRAGSVGKYYHQEKTIEAAKLDIYLIHIFEYEWKDENKRKKIIELIKGVIKSRVGLGIYEGYLELSGGIRELSKQEEEEFLNNKHIDGYTNSSISYGLYIENELVEVISFENKGENEWELLRAASKYGINEIEWVKRLIAQFILENEVERIVAYCDISKFNGSEYVELGFETEGITPPDYKWIKQNYTPNMANGIISSKQVMEQSLIGIRPGKHGDTEDEIMTKLGYYKIYDSGSLKFTLVTN